MTTAKYQAAQVNDPFYPYFYCNRCRMRVCSRHSEHQFDHDKGLRHVTRACPNCGRERKDVVPLLPPKPKAAP